MNTVFRTAPTQIDEEPRKIDWKPIVPLALVVVVIAGGFVRLDDADTGGSVTVAFAYGPASYEDQPCPGLDVQIASLDDSVHASVEAGATVVVFTELAFSVNSSEWDTMLNHTVYLAHDEDVIIFLSTEVKIDSERTMNQTSLVTPSDGLVWTYEKNHPVPFIEPTVVPGDGSVPCADTVIGRIATVICYDLEFPLTVNKAASDTDVLFAPSWDWKSLEGWRTQSNAYRAVENGFSLVKCTCDGVSGSYDAYGREVQTVASHLDSYDGPYTLTIKTQGVQTVFGQYGHLINAVFLVGAIIVIAYSAASWLRRRDQTD